MTEDEMVGWHHRLDGHEFEQVPGVGDGQGSLVCCRPRSRKELDMTEQLNWESVSHSVVSDSLRPHGRQHTRLPCPSPIPRVCSNSCPSSRWCHPAISPLLSPSPPALNLPQHQGLFWWVSSSNQLAKVVEFQFQNQAFQWIFIQDWFPLGWTGLISLLSKGL